MLPCDRLVSKYYIQPVTCIYGKDPTASSFLGSGVFAAIQKQPMKFISFQDPELKLD